MYGRDKISILQLRKLKSEKSCNLPNAMIQTYVHESPKHSLSFQDTFLPYSLVL